MYVIKYICICMLLKLSNMYYYLIFILCVIICIFISIYIVYSPYKEYFINISDDPEM